MQRKWPTSLGFPFFEFFFAFPFSFLYAAVIDLLLGLLGVKKLLRKCQRNGQFLRRSRQVKWQEILLQVFHSAFWAFLCITRTPFGQSPWSEHHWKDVLFLHKLSIDDANFWSKGMTSEVEERPVTTGMGVTELTMVAQISLSKIPWLFPDKINISLTKYYKIIVVPENIHTHPKEKKESEALEPVLTHSCWSLSRFL